jgi:hypothetical protein
MGYLLAYAYSTIAFTKSFRAEGNSGERAGLYHVPYHPKSNERRTLYRVL